MNYLPLSGGWFYGALTATEMATYYCSYGLLSLAPGVSPSRGFIGSLFGSILGG